jgi:hypothetical protein
MMPFDGLQKWFTGKSDAYEKTRSDLFPDKNDEDDQEKEKREKKEKEKLQKEQEEAMRIANGKKESKKSEGGGFWGSGW